MKRRVPEATASNEAMLPELEAGRSVIFMTLRDDAFFRIWNIKCKNL